MKLENIIKFDLKKKIITSIIMFLVLILSIVFFVVIPAVRDIKSIKMDIEAQKIDLEKKYLKGQSLRRLSEKIKEIEKKIKVLDQVFVAENDSLGFITALEDVADRNFVEQKIDLLSLEDASEDVFREIPVKLFSTGNINNQLNYLVDLETLHYYINIKSLELRSSSGGDYSENGGLFSGNTSLFVSADTFWQ